MAGVAIAMALAASFAHAQQAPAIVAVRVTPDTATVGDRLELTIEVDHDDAFTVEGPGFGEDFGKLELIAIADPRTESNAGVSRTTFVYTLAPFVTGAVELPPLPVRWRGAAGEGEISTPAQRITIQSVLTPGENEPRPLKPQLEIADPAPLPIAPILYVAVFAALTALGYVMVSRAIGTRPAVSAAAPEIAPTPAEAARASLDALAAADAGGRDLARYYASIAATMRRYLSERYGFPAYAMTRSELQRHMTHDELGRWPARLTENLLEGCDAVQFAGFAPAPERADADLTAAYEIIELTQPGEELVVLETAAASAE
jgi:hypothetical protein